ncbi:hypothetical protein FS837_009476 [Tulasnella sp. UAMH 9824]|nr:hypothetical protein FS837_009476 [Tulasnella sp. UAMH 9824]
MPFRTTDADASNLLARRLSQPQLRPDEAAYANIWVSYYKSQYGAAKTFEDLLRDATEVCDKANIPKIPLQSFKLGDIVMAEVLLKKYLRKTGGQKNGDFGLLYDLQVFVLLKPRSMKDHEEFVAAKEGLTTASAARTAGAVL